MRSLLTIILLISLLTMADGTRLMGTPNAQSVENNIKVEQIDIQANAAGASTARSDSTITGELIGVSWDKGNFTGVGTATIKTSLPLAFQIDSFNMSLGPGFRLPGVKLQGSTDEYVPYNLFSQIWVNTTGVQAWGHGMVYIIWR